jgi:RNA polymerase sigma-70 factor (ECF subfamily)
MTREESQTARADAHGVTSTSRSLLVQLKDDDAKAWDRVVILYTPLVYYWCQKLDLKRDDIPDVVQEVFKSVAEHIADFRKERSQDTFRGWLRVITRNKAIDHYRRRAKDADAAGGTEALQRMAALPAPESGDDATDEAESQNILFHQALACLREDFHERTWKAFWRVVVDDCTPAEVADELQMTPGAVRVAKCRVLQRLREHLGDVVLE